MRFPRSPLLLALSLVWSAGCEADAVVPGGDAIDRIELDPPSLELSVGGVARLDVSVRNAEGARISVAAVAWSSSSPEVAAVDSLGVIRALAEGSSQISATVEGVTGVSALRVVSAPPGVWREHACGVDVQGGGWCWGRGVNGELGHGERSGSAVPVPVHVQAPLAALSVGAGHTCGVTTTGDAFCWGRGSEGQLGDGTTRTRARPEPVGDRRYRSVSAGGRHTCGISVAGGARCWGSGSRGGLGNGDTVDVSTPVLVEGGTRFDTVLAGGEHSCALTVAGEAFCWGDNAWGQLGDGTASGRTRPTRVATDVRFSRLTAGARHTCGLDAQGGAWCWGDNRDGQLGTGTLEGARVPAEVRSASTFRLASISAGAVHTCGVHVDGLGYCWGGNGFGQLGDGSHRLAGNPIAVQAALYRTITAGAGHTCGVSEGSTILCWGFGGFGQLGDGTRVSRPDPRPVAGDLRFGGGP